MGGKTAAHYRFTFVLRRSKAAESLLRIALFPRDLATLRVSLSTPAEPHSLRLSSTAKVLVDVSIAFHARLGQILLRPKRNP